ncbi:hypothetical protein Dda_7605 [Drechslerella dactyloides]|uniref:Uncharacterized protein n=1 Tax=Drechslerella dactyloides TaxID=74499 RepID=A0AAD6NFQ7_DREDA|nr:hypothetical protein Dda_7605 [Drechslerella dactyloides]
MSTWSDIASCGSSESSATLVDVELTPYDGCGSEASSEPSLPSPVYGSSIWTCSSGYLNGKSQIYIKHIYRHDPQTDNMGSTEDQESFAPVPAPAPAPAPPTSTPRGEKRKRYFFAAVVAGKLIAVLCTVAGIALTIALCRVPGGRRRESLRKGGNACAGLGLAAALLALIHHRIIADQRFQQRWYGEKVWPKRHWAIECWWGDVACFLFPAVWFAGLRTIETTM